MRKNNYFICKHSPFGEKRAVNPMYQNLLSQQSLRSCTSSDLAASQTLDDRTDRTTMSYITASSDTLHWDRSQDSSQTSPRVKCRYIIRVCDHHQRRPHNKDHVKLVKSWDNLATRAEDTGAALRNKCNCDYLNPRDGRSYSTKNVSQLHFCDQCLNGSASSKSLFFSQNISNSSLSCEYLLMDENNPTFISNEEGRFVPVLVSGNDLTGTGTHKDKGSQTDNNKRIVNVLQTPEITRL